MTIKYLSVGLISLLFGHCAQADIIADMSKNPEILSASLSPQGDYIGVLREVDGKRAVFVFTFPEMKNTAVLSYPGRYDVGSFRWVNDERIVATVTVNWDRFTDDRGTGELFGINADGTKPEHLFGYRAGADETINRTQRTRNEFASASISNRLWDDPRHVLINITYWTRGLARVTETAKMDVYTGRISAKVRAPASDASLISDSKGNIRFSFSVDDDQNSVIHIRDQKTKQWSVFSKTPYGEASTSPLLVTDDNKIYVRHSPDGGPYGIYLMDPTTQKYEAVYRHDLVDASAMQDRNGNIYGVRVMPDLPRFESIDDEHPLSRLTRSLQQTFPESAPYLTNATADGSLVLAAVIKDDKTPELYLYDAKQKQLSLLFDALPWVDDSKLPQMRPIKVSARDGMELHGYLTVPPGTTAHNLPLIVVPHGGPHGPRDEWGYNGFFGVIAASGYATLAINFRGSGGYGNNFESAGHRQWGKKMQDDVTDATLWAIEQGIADPERVCIFGWSYGGYSTLMGIVREPELYQCAVAGAGVYDQEIQYRGADFTRFTRFGKKYMDRVIGPSKEDRRQASPTTYVNRIQTPLMLVHGDKDERVPIEHMYALEKAMQAAGKPKPKRLILKKEPHGPRNPKNVESMWRQILVFFEQHIGPGQIGDPVASSTG